MMLKLQPDPTFKSKVGIPVPAGKPVQVEFEFKAKTRTQLQQYLRDSEGREDAENLAEIVTGWAGVDTPYSAEALAVLLDNYVGSARAILDTYIEQLTRARTGN